MRIAIRYLQACDAGIELDREDVLCLRSVLMKPQHREWLDRIWSVLQESADEAGAA